MPKHKSFYNIYDDGRLIAQGTVEECTEQLGKGYETIVSTIKRAKKGESRYKVETVEIPYRLIRLSDFIKYFPKAPCEYNDMRKYSHCEWCLEHCGLVNETICWDHAFEEEWYK